MTRGEFLRLGVGASAGVVLGRLDALAQIDTRSARVATVIQEYDAQGLHRTATDVDHRSGQWLTDQATRAGADARLESFDINRVDVRGAFIEAEGRRADGLPFFDGGFTDAAGVSGRVGPPEAKLPLALVVIDSPGISSEGRSIQALRRSTLHRGIVAVTDGAHEGLSTSNAGRFPHAVRPARSCRSRRKTTCGSAISRRAACPSGLSPTRAGRRLAPATWSPRCAAARPTCHLLCS